MSHDDTDTPRPHEMPPARHRKRGWRVGFAIVAIVSVIVLFTPQTGVPAAPPGVDKAVHLLLFAALAWTGAFAWAGVDAGRQARRWAVVGAWAGVGAAARRRLAAALVMYAAVSELVQASPLLDRSASIADLIADAAGIALGLAAAGLTGTRAARRR